MNQEFSDISANYNNSSRFTHCIGYVKSLPFKDMVDFSVLSLNVKYRDILVPFSSVKQYLQNNQYHMISIQGDEEIDAKYRSLNEMNTIKTIKSNFTQLTVLADEAGADYADLLDQVNRLEQFNAELLEPIKRTIDYSSELGMLCPYLVKSKNLATHATYVEMLNELNAEYKDVLVDNSYYDIFENIKKVTDKNVIEFKGILDNLIDRINEANPEVLSTMSSKYVAELNSSTGDISQFLLDKTFDETITAAIKLEENQKIQAYIIFKDNSIAVKSKGKFSTVNTMDELDDTFTGLKESIVAYKLKKRPKIAKFFIGLAKESIHFDHCMNAMNTFLDNEQVLKNMKMDFNLFVDKSFEVIDDHMNALISEHKTHQYANSILSNKNKHLLSPTSMISFKQLKEMDVTETELQNIIGKKIAAIKTPEDLEAYLVKVVGQYTGFSHEAVSSKLERVGIQPVYDEGQVLVFPVKEYKDSKELGSPSWCIVRTESYFDTYTDYDKKQYFMYDFNKNEKDNESLIGFTLTYDGEFHTQHLRNDDYLTVDDNLQHIADKIMFRDKNDFNLSKEKLASLEDMFNKQMKKTTNKHKQGL
jgi:hypothetical protein